MKVFSATLCSAAACVVLTVTRFAQSDVSASQSSPPSAEELAEMLSNPVANLITLPMQVDWDGGVGPDEDVRFTTKFQPVLPFALNEDWNLIARVIVPFVSQPALYPGSTPTFGTSDILLSAFLSPQDPHPFIWGAGPALLLPTTADPSLGTEKWALGPTAVILKQSRGFTYGALVNHIWSFAGDEKREDVCNSLVQPFLAYTTHSAITLSVSSESTKNWKADSGEQWTVPIIFQASKLTQLGPIPMSVAVGYAYFADKPDGGPSWKIRSSVTLLLPAKK
ncbi:MAG: transporter [Acidobacteriota bacterium]